MNYCVVAFAIWLSISLIQWIVDGRKNYTGPKLDDQVLEAVIEQERSREAEATAGPKASHGEDPPKPHKYA